MAKNSLYGNRWKSVSTISEGGQAQLFRVVDTTGEREGEFALKRIKNPARRDRFRAEVLAIKRLSHSGIITLVDHSAIDDLTGSPDAQYLVMPLAAGGDLSRPGTVALYKENIEAVITVAKQVAGALQAAHEAKVVHRDIKPPNILRTGQGHDVWISDFGICLLRDEERLTASGEVMGPREYMAPELAGGGNLDVGPEADVYSLGKLIYFLLSGGVILPRERLFEDVYAGLFAKSDQYGLMKILLSKMICAQDRRISSMSQVVSELDKIERWVIDAHAVALTPTALARIGQLREQALNHKQIERENAVARAQENQDVQTVSASFLFWLRAELEKIVPMVAQAEEIKCSISEVNKDDGQSTVVQVGAGAYVSIAGFNLSVSLSNDSFFRVHTLTLLLSEFRKVMIEVHVNGRSSPPVRRPAVDPKLAFLPMYRESLIHQAPNAYAQAGYLMKPQYFDRDPRPGGLVRGVQNRFRATPGALRYTPSFAQNMNQHLEFPASQWPEIIEQLNEALKQALETFTAIVGEGAEPIPQPPM